MNEYDESTYKVDFPGQGNLNWKTVRLNTPENVYYDKHTITGVLLHDGKCMVNGVLFNADQFFIIDESPLLPSVYIPELNLFAIAQFRDIEQQCKRIHSGNAPHQAKTVEGIAVRAIEFIKKYY
jgi:hypothetical protein